MSLLLLLLLVLVLLLLLLLRALLVAISSCCVCRVCVPACVMTDGVHGGSDNGLCARGRRVRAPPRCWLLLRAPAPPRDVRWRHGCGAQV